MLIERIPKRVHHGAARQTCRRDLPQLLDTEREHLRLIADRDARAANQLLREIAANAVGEYRHFRMDIDARFERAAFLAMAADTAIAGSHADDAMAVHQQLGGPK